MRESVLRTDGLPDGARTAISAAVKAYVELVETGHWPAMAAGSTSLRRIPSGSSDAMNALREVVDEL